MLSIVFLALKRIIKMFSFVEPSELGCFIVIIEEELIVSIWCQSCKSSSGPNTIIFLKWPILAHKFTSKCCCRSGTKALYTPFLERFYDFWFIVSGKLIAYQQIILLDLNKIWKRKQFLLLRLLSILFFLRVFETFFLFFHLW